MTNAKAAMEYAAKIEREAIKKGTTLGAAFDKAYEEYEANEKQEWPTTMGMEYAANFEKAEKMLGKKEWVSLTEDDIKAIVGRNDPGGIGLYTRDLFKKIEDKLREKNT